MIDRIRRRLATALNVESTPKAIRMHASIALGSSLGLVRQRNEDCCLVVRGSYAKTPRADFTMAIVCDGIGGMSHGREASVLAASAFAAYLYCSARFSWEERLASAVAFANQEIYKRLRGSGGTTLSAVIVPVNSDAMLCHVGDSRIYGISSEHVLKQLSRDDTIDALLNKREDKPNAPKDSRLLQFVGMGDEMEAQVCPVPRQTNSILLTSDGAHDAPNSVLQRLVSAASGGGDLVRKLLSLSDILGGRDNASAVLLPLGRDAECSPMNAENELLAILPGETLSICIAASEMFEGPRRVDRRPAPEALPSPQSSHENVSPAPPADDTSAQPKQVKPAPTEKMHSRKSNKRRSRAKTDPATRLPLEEPRPEVDVQFSSPSPNTEDRGEK